MSNEGQSLYRAILRLTRTRVGGRRPQLYPGQRKGLWEPGEGESTDYRPWPLPSLTRRIRENARFAIECHASVKETGRKADLIKGGWQDVEVLKKLGSLPKETLEAIFPEAFLKIKGRIEKSRSRTKGRGQDVV